MKMLLSSKGVAVETRQFQSSHGPKAVEDIFVKGKRMRVFILNMYSLFASQVLCKVSTMSVPLFIIFVIHNKVIIVKTLVEHLSMSQCVLICFIITR